MGTKVPKEIVEIILKVKNYRPRHGSRGHKGSRLIAEDIRPECNLTKDISFDDLQLARLRLELERFAKKDISDEEIERIETVQDVMNLLGNIVISKGGGNLGLLQYFRGRGKMKTTKSQETDLKPLPNLGLTNYFKFGGQSPVKRSLKSKLPGRIDGLARYFQIN